MRAQALADDLRADLLGLAHRQRAQLEGPVAHPDQPVHRQAQRLQHPAHLAVLSFGEGQGDPDVGGALLAGLQLGVDRPVADALYGDAILQLVQPRLVDPPVRPGAVAARPGVGRQFQRPGQAAVVGQEQQALGVQVESTDGDQPRQALGQRLEHRRPALGIAVAGHQSRRLVIAEHPGRFGGGDHLAVEGDDVGGRNLHRRGGQTLAVQGHPPGRDQPLDFPARGDAGPGQHLGDALAGFGRALTRVRIAGSVL